MVASTTMMQPRIKRERATDRALMPDRGGEYLEAFRRGAGIPHRGPHAIPANETSVFLRVKTARSMSSGLG